MISRRRDAQAEPDSESVFTLAYVSTLSARMSSTALERLLKSSRQRNGRHRITGLLTISDQHVMQTLEGPEDDVRRLFERIEQDLRHHSVTVVWTSRHPTRRFPEWAMGYDDLDVAVEDDAPAPGVDERTSPQIDPVSDPDAEEYVGRRERVLRRALASGDRLVVPLAIILDGHRPEAALRNPSEAIIRCAECQRYRDAAPETYPCPTARNAIWALEGAVL